MAEDELKVIIVPEDCHLKNELSGYSALAQCRVGGHGYFDNWSGKTKASMTSDTAIDAQT